MASWRINASVLRILIILASFFLTSGPRHRGTNSSSPLPKATCPASRRLSLQKPDVNATVDRGLTALMAASLNGHTDVVRTLADAVRRDKPA